MHKLRAMETKTLRVVIFREGAGWVSQCIDHDLNGQGSNVREAIKSIVRVFATQATLDQRDGVPLFSRTRRAPNQFEGMFEESLELSQLARVPVDGGAEAQLRIHA